MTAARPVMYIAAMARTGWRIRPAVPADREWILPLVPRLHEFGPPPWRPVDVMDAAERGTVAAALDGPRDDAALFVAEDAAGGAASRSTPLGFVYVVTMADFFTGERHGHVFDIVVARDGEGRGVGRALLDAAERWARGCGYRLLTLHVFVGNGRARALYERAGFEPEQTKMVKVLDA